MATLSRRGAASVKSEPADIRSRAFSERSDSGFSDTCLSSHGPGLDSSIEEEQECEELLKPKGMFILRITYSFSKYLLYIVRISFKFERKKNV